MPLDLCIMLGLSGYGLARECRVPRTRIERLAREETPVTAAGPLLRHRAGILDEPANDLRPA